MTKKDPYLSELDALEGEEGMDVDNEATSVDIQTPHSSSQQNDTDFSQSLPAEGAPIIQDLLNLAPDVPVSVVVVMGKKSVSVQDLLQMRIGEVVELEKGLLDPVDVVVAGKVIAKAELVDVDGKLGIRILKLLK